MGRRYNILNAPNGWVDDYSIYLDGVDEYVNIDSVQTALSATTQGGLMFWYKPVLASPASNAFILCFADTNANTYIALSHRTNGKLRLSIVLSGVPQYQLETNSGVFSNDTWNHCAIVQNGTVGVFYIDGVEYSVAQGNATSSTVVDTGAWFSDLPGIDNGTIGCLNFNSAGTLAFTNGNFDDPLFVNVAPNAAAVLDVYNSGSPKDESAITNGVSYYLTGDASGDNWNSGVANEWQFIDQISSNNAFTVNCEQADVELDTP